MMYRALSTVGKMVLHKLFFVFVVQQLQLCFEEQLVGQKYHCFFQRSFHSLPIFEYTLQSNNLAQIVITHA